MNQYSPIRSKCRALNTIKDWNRGLLRGQWMCITLWKSKCECQSVCVCVWVDGLNEVVRSHKDMEKGVCLSLGECQTDHTLTGPPPALWWLANGMKSGTKITRAFQHSHESGVSVTDRTMIPPQPQWTQQKPSMASDRLKRCTEND